jgi:hypothetical protein
MFENNKNFKMRTSKRLSRLNAIKFDEKVKELGGLVHVFVENPYMKVRERCLKIKEIYNMIYENRYLLHAFVEEEFMVKFMMHYIKKGQEILDNSEKKANIKIYKKAITRTLVYAKDYLKKRNEVVNLALYKISKNTCKDVSCVIKGYL